MDLQAIRPPALLEHSRAPGGDAAVLRVSGPGLPPSARCLALSTDANPRWCKIDPRIGTSWLVVESVMNIACAGARAVALVNCLNFGNPEHPEVMWELSEAIDGMAEACRALDLPVVGGNVSLYNESSGTDISPTPVVAALGVIDDLVTRPPGMSLYRWGLPRAPRRQVLRTCGLAPRRSSGWAWAVDR